MQLRDAGLGESGTGERGRFTLPISLLLLGVGYVVMVAGPLLSTRGASYSTESLSTAFASLPTGAAAGIALLGAAAMVLLLVQLVRDVERHPYASVAPVLAVFSAYLLASTRAKLPFPGWASEHLGVFVLMLALVGGGLLQQRDPNARAWGWSLATIPFLGFTAALLWSLPGVPSAALMQADAAVQTYLLLLGVSVLALGISGAIARTLVFNRGEAGAAGGLRLTQGYAGAQSMPGGAPRHTNPGMHPSLVPGQQLRHSAEGLHASMAGQRGPRLNTMDRAFDADIARMMRGKGNLRPLLISALAIALAAVGGYMAFSKFGSLSAAVVDLAGKPLETKPEAQPKQRPAVLTESIAKPSAAAAAPAAPEPSPAPAAAAPAAAAASAVPAAVDTRMEVRSDARSRSEERREKRAEKRRRQAEEGSSKAEANDRASAKVVDAKEPAADKLEKSDKLHKADKGEKADKVEKSEKAEAASRSSQTEKPAPAKPAAPTQNEKDLDLDQLINKAVRKPNGVNAADDPLLGL